MGDSIKELTCFIKKIPKITSNFTVSTYEIGDCIRELTFLIKRKKFTNRWQLHASTMKRSNFKYFYSSFENLKFIYLSLIIDLMFIFYLINFQKPKIVFILILLSGSHST